MIPVEISIGMSFEEPTPSTITKFDSKNEDMIVNEQIELSIDRIDKTTVTKYLDIRGEDERSFRGQVYYNELQQWLMLLWKIYMAL